MIKTYKSGDTVFILNFYGKIDEVVIKEKENELKVLIDREKLFMGGKDANSIAEELMIDGSYKLESIEVFTKGREVGITRLTSREMSDMNRIIDETEKETYTTSLFDTYF